MLTGVLEVTREGAEVIESIKEEVGEVVLTGVLEVTMEDVGVAGVWRVKECCGRIGLKMREQGENRSWIPDSVKIGPSIKESTTFMA